MISEKCRFSYYPMNIASNTCKFEADLDVAFELFNTARIISVTGYKNGIVLAAKNRVGQWGLIDNTYLIPYTPDMVEAFFGYDDNLADIINAYLERRAESAYQARTFFMAKVLGGKDEV